LQQLWNREKLKSLAYFAKVWAIEGLMEVHDGEEWIEAFVNA